MMKKKLNFSITWINVTLDLQNEVLMAQLNKITLRNRTFMISMEIYLASHRCHCFSFKFFVSNFISLTAHIFK